MTDAGELEIIYLPAQSEQRGPPLLFIHGGFHGAWCWADHFMPWFAARGRDCHAVSLREHGANPRTDKADLWRLADYVDDALWAVRQIAQPPLIIGHSLGGSVAQKVAERADVSGLVLLAPSPIGGSNRAALRMTLTQPRAMLGGFLRGDMAATLPAFESFFFSDDLPAADRQRILPRLNGHTSFKAAADAFWRDPPKPAQSGLPVLVVSGEQDWSIPRYKNERLARAWGGGHIMVPTAHDIMCDTRWENAAQAILGWLEDWGFGEKITATNFGR